MATRLVVHPPGEYEAWLRTAGERNKHMSPVQRRRHALSSKCLHAMPLDRRHGGNRPEFQGHFRPDVALADGTSVMVEDNYIRETILEPGRKSSRAIPC